MDWELKRAIDDMKNALKESPLNEIRVSTCLAHIESLAKDVADKSRKEIEIARAIKEERKDDFAFIKETLNDKRTQFAWSFVANMILIIVLAGVFLAGKLK